jgi:hypothetical protein
MFVCRDMPTMCPTPPSVSSDPRNIQPGDADAWKRYERDMLEALTQYAYSGGTLASVHTKFYAVFDPAGYMRISDTEPNLCVLYGLTVVQVGGTRVVAYAFYPLNVNAGTRIVFE